MWSLCGAGFTEGVWLYPRVEFGAMETRLESHSAYFSSMVALIPQQFYSVKDQDQKASDSKYWVNKKQPRAPKQAVKEASKKAKRLKFDLESQNTLESRKEEPTIEDKDGEEHDEEVGEEEGVSRGSGFSVENVRSRNLNDLQERLKRKIEELRGKRKTRDFEEPDEIAQKRLKRAERKKRKKEMRQKKKQKVTSKADESTSQRPCIKDEESGRLVFSKFDFTTPQSVQPFSSTSTGKKKKDYRKLLAKAEAAQKKLEEIKEKDEQKGEELQEKLQWQRAVEKAKGNKLKDDPKLLKKTVKRIEKKKEKSRKQWSKRQKVEEQSKEKRQERRTKNIKARTEQIKAKKMKKRRRPGF